MSGKLIGRGDCLLVSWKCVEVLPGVRQKVTYSAAQPCEGKMGGGI